MSKKNSLLRLSLGLELRSGAGIVLIGYINKSVNGMTSY